MIPAGFVPSVARCVDRVADQVRALFAERGITATVWADGPHGATILVTRHPDRAAFSHPSDLLLLTRRDLRAAFPGWRIDGDGEGRTIVRRPL